MPFTRKEAEILRDCIQSLSSKHLKSTRDHKQDWDDKKPGVYVGDEVYDFMQSTGGLFFETWVRGPLIALLEGNLKLAASMAKPQHQDLKQDVIEEGDFVVYVGPPGEFTTFSGKVIRVANGMALCSGKVSPGDTYGPIYRDEVLFGLKDLFKMGRA